MITISNISIIVFDSSHSIRVIILANGMKNQQRIYQKIELNANKIVFQYYWYGVLVTKNTADLFCISTFIKF